MSISKVDSMWEEHYAVTAAWEEHYAVTACGRSTMQ
jgi:hypothetical protein